MSIVTQFVLVDSVLRSLPVRHLLSMGGEKRAAEIDEHKLVPQVKELIKELVEQDLFSTEGVPEKQIPLKVLALSKAFKIFEKSTIESIYRELISEYGNNGEKETVFKNVFFDTVVMGGTPSCIRFFKERLEKGEVSKIQSASLFLYLPRTVISPTHRLLEEIFELIKCEKVAYRNIRPYIRSGFSTCDVTM